MRRTNTRRMAARKARPAAKRRGRVAAVRTRSKAVAPRRGRAVAPRRGRVAAVRTRRRGARGHMPGHNGNGVMCPAGMMMNASGQCVPINGGGGYRKTNTRVANRTTRSGYRKSGAALLYGGQNIVNQGGVQYDCPPGVNYVGGGCVPISHGYSQST